MVKAPVLQHVLCIFMHMSVDQQPFFRKGLLHGIVDAFRGSTRNCRHFVAAVVALVVAAVEEEVVAVVVVVVVYRRRRSSNVVVRLMI